MHGVLKAQGICGCQDQSHDQTWCLLHPIPTKKIINTMKCTQINAMQVHDPRKGFENQYKAFHSQDGTQRYSPSI